MRGFTSDKWMGGFVVAVVNGASAAFAMLNASMAETVDGRFVWNWLAVMTGAVAVAVTTVLLFDGTRE